MVIAGDELPWSPPKGSHESKFYGVAPLGFIGGTPDALAKMLKGEIVKWSEVAKSASLK